MEPYVFDLRRIFIGDLSWGLAFEIVFRTLVMYVFALFLLRVIGNRGLGQLSPFEYAIIFAMGAAVGDPMFYPELPLLHGMLVLTGIVALNRIMVNLSNRNDRIEAFIEGKPYRLVKDGQLDLDGMNQAALSREEVFMQMRHAGVRQLGEVERAYIELDGEVSTFLFSLKEIRPGMPIVPPWDVNLDRPHTWNTNDTVPESGDYACRNCGEVVHLEAGDRFPACVSCEGTEWVLAVKQPLNARQEQVDGA
jgi:uncharacterized membrane protein YcaP (DUF421 family)